MAARKTKRKKKATNEKRISLFPMKIDEAMLKAFDALTPEEATRRFMAIVEKDEEEERRKKGETDTP